MSRDIVFLPGTLCDARAFTAQVDHLAASGWQASVPAHQAGQADLAAWASALLATLPGRFALVGHSLGALVAQEIIHSHPGRVSHLALLSSSVGEFTATAAAIIRADRQECARAGLEAFMRDTMVPRYLALPGDADSAVADLVVAMAVGQGIGTWHDQLRLVATRRRLDAAIARLEVPVLVACGAADRITPPERSQEIARLCPAATLIEWAGCGHLPTLENPAAVNTALARLLATG